MLLTTWLRAQLLLVTKLRAAHAVAAVTEITVFEAKGPTILDKRHRLNILIILIETLRILGMGLHLDSALAADLPMCCVELMISFLE